MRGSPWGGQEAKKSRVTSGSGRRLVRGTARTTRLAHPAGYTVTAMPTQPRATRCGPHGAAGSSPADCPMISLESVAKAYGGRQVLAPTSLAVRRGSTTVLIGPSGCGKSTLLRMIVGLVTPDQGTVTIDGRRLDAASVADLRRRIGYVIQDGGLFPHLTGRDNVGLLARHLGAGRIVQRGTLADLIHAPADDFVRRFVSAQRFPGLTGSEGRNAS